MYTYGFISGESEGETRYLVLTRYFNIAPTFILPTFTIARHIYISVNMEIYFRGLLMEEEILKVLYVTCCVYIYR